MGVLVWEPEYAWVSHLRESRGLFGIRAEQNEHGYDFPRLQFGQRVEVFFRRRGGGELYIVLGWTLGTHLSTWSVSYGVEARTLAHI